MIAAPIQHLGILAALFSAAALLPDFQLCVVTGDTRHFGNVVLAVGVEPRG